MGLVISALYMMILSTFFTVSVVLGFLPVPFIIFLPVLVFLYWFKSRQKGEMWKGSRQVKIEQKPLLCIHCEGDKWFKRETIVATTLVAFFFGAAWNKSARCYQCSRCSELRLFSRDDQEITEC